MSKADYPSAGDPSQSVLTIGHLVYGLHGAALVIGILGAATVIGSFLGSLPSVAALILSYINRSSAQGTWIESHCRWQIRTFWYALLFFLLAWLLLITVIGVPVGVVVLAIVTLWLLYRITRGWVRLAKGKPMYAGKRARGA